MRIKERSALTTFVNKYKIGRHPVKSAKLRLRKMINQGEEEEEEELTKEDRDKTALNRLRHLGNAVANSRRGDQRFRRDTSTKSGNRKPKNTGARVRRLAARIGAKATGKTPRQLTSKQIATTRRAVDRSQERQHQANRSKIHTDPKSAKKAFANRNETNEDKDQGVQKKAPTAKGPSPADQIKHITAKAKINGKNMMLKAKTTMAVNRSNMSAARAKAQSQIDLMKTKSEITKKDNEEARKANFHQRRHDYLSQLDSLRISRLTKMYGGGGK